MKKREPIKKSTRFEVFKRDSFTCQYCGAKAPDVLLHVDHIKPVASGGTSDIMNLVTSCASCNGGKGKVELSDDTAVAKQRNQMAALEERRQQISLMLEWRNGLAKVEDDIVTAATVCINDHISPRSINEYGLKDVKRLLKKHGLKEFIEAADISAEKYLAYDDDGDPTEESCSLFLRRIGGILNLKKATPIKKLSAYIRGIARNRFGNYREQKGAILLANLHSEMSKAGWDDFSIHEFLTNEILDFTKQVENWTQWCNHIETHTEHFQNLNEGGQSHAN